MAIPELEDYASSDGGAGPILERRKTNTPRIVGILTLIIFVALLIFASHSILLIVAALLLGTVLRDLANSVSQRTPLSNGWSLAAILLIVLLLLVGFGFMAAPEVAKQADQLTDALSQSVDQATSWLNQYGWGRRAVNQARQAMQGGGGGAMLRRAGRYFSSVFSAVTDLLIILVLGVFFAASLSSYQKGFLRLFPQTKRPRAKEVTNAVGETVGEWFRGVLLSVAFMATATYIGLSIIGVPLALILAVIVGVMTFVPFLGPALALVPIGLISMSESPTTALWAVGYYVLLESIEGNLLTPLIQKKAVDLPPVLLLGAQVVLGSLFGFYGIILAAPLTAIGLVLVKMLYMEDVLGQHTEHPGSS